MYLSRFLSIHALWVTVSSVMQPYPLVWGHYDVCKTQIYTEEGKVWDYMACQPESTDMTKYLKVKLDPPDITCGDPPEAFCAMMEGKYRMSFARVQFLLTQVLQDAFKAFLQGPYQVYRWVQSEEVQIAHTSPSGSGENYTQQYLEIVHQRSSLE
ncbi:hypothetical protein U0070_008236 [Myodes glareolus]|uniref:Uncharacterized protein n=1 Tax=Myodes glareolus TaxID=447135 RepID=A0AAW0I884_MYOGA